MNRMEEYQALRLQLGQPVPELDNTLLRANARLQRKRMLLYRSLGSLAACFAFFVLLVNVCAPVAYACSKVPGLRELAEAVTFSRSLTDAVSNDYVQPIALQQTQNGITASVEYLIVDQKQVNVFFRLNGEGHETLDADVDFTRADGQRIGSCTWGPNDYDVPTGQLQSATIELFEGDVPGTMRFHLDVWDRKIDRSKAPEAEERYDMFSPPPHKDPDYLAQFQFVLEFDPTFTAAVKIYPVEQTVMLEGNAVTVQQVEVYPTHLRVIVEDDPRNPAKLQRLFFHIETDWGMKFYTESNGTVSFGVSDSQVTTYRADSSYFYNADRLRMVITAAEWLDRDMETVYVNLVTGETGKLPEDVEFLYANKEESGWLVGFKATQRKWSSKADSVSHQLFDMTFEDAQGNAYEIRSWSHGIACGLPEEEWDTHFGTEFPLAGCHEDEVWLKPHYSHVWQATVPVTVTIQ